MPYAAPLTPGFYSGIDGRVFLNGVELSITKWSGDYDCPSSDRTHSKGGGFRQVTRTIKSFKGTASCVITNDADGDPAFEIGNSYPIVLIMHDLRGFSFPAYMATISPSTETSGDAGFDIKFESNGHIYPWTNADLSDTAATATGITGQADSPTGTV